MSKYLQFCKEGFDEKGALTHFSLHYPENFNFAYDVVDTIAMEEPEKLAMVWCNPQGEEHFFTFSQLSKRSNQLANALKKEGVSKGDTVLVMLKRHYDYWFVSLALHKLGAIMSPITHMLQVSDLVYRCEAAKIKFAICTPENNAPEKFVETKKSTTLEKIFTVKEDAPDCLNLTKLGDEQSDCFPRVDTLATDTMFTYFTSGTTGNPKGVKHSHSYPLAHIITAKYWHDVRENGLHFTVAETGWAKASWGKLYGQWLCGSAVMVYDFDSFDPRALMQVINKYKVTTFCAPPTIYRYLVKTGLQPMPSLVHVTTAGEPLNPEVFAKFRDFTGLSLAEAYGQTETTPILLNPAWCAPKAGSIGRANPLYDVSLQNSDGSKTPLGEVGEIVISPRADGSVPQGIFYEYLDNEALFAKVWEHGVYHTGDMAWMDEDGYYWFNGRADDIIKTGGYRVGPYEIENVLMKHEAVLECSVLGVEDKLRGQAIKAFVHLAPGYEASTALKQELKQFCSERLAEYKWIRFLDFVEEMPKTISGKIKKRDLKAWDAVGS